MDPTGREVEARLRIGFLLDARWFAMKNMPERTKEPTLKLLVDLLQELEIPYAIIGGMALQAYVADPRTTVDIDVAVREVPLAALEAVGFKHTGSFEHSENYRSPDGIMVQFSPDAEWDDVIERAKYQDVLGRRIRFIAPVDLVRAKLRAASDLARRRSKRMQDATDIATLLEQHPELRGSLDDREKSEIDRLLSGLGGPA